MEELEPATFGQVTQLSQVWHSNQLSHDNGNWSTDYKKVPVLSFIEDVVWKRANSVTQLAVLMHKNRFCDEIN